MSSAIAAIHAGLKQLGISDEEDKRALYVRVTREDGLRKMTDDQQQAVVTELRRLGFQPVARRPDGRQKLTGKYAPKLQALWIAGYNLGIIRERDDAAMLAFIKRQTGIDHTRFLRDDADGRKAIEGLKGWMAREAGVDWTINKTTPDWAKADGYKIAWAQWVILVGVEQAKISKAFWEAVVGILGRQVSGRELTAQEWIPVMNELGRRVRKAKAVS